MNGSTMFEMRKRRAAALVPTVRKTDGGYRVGSATRDISYLVTKPNGRLVCTCRDFQLHEQQPDFNCKHILAVEAALQEGGLSDRGNGHPVLSVGGPTPPDGMNIIHRYLPNEDPVRLKLTNTIHFPLTNNACTPPLTE